MGNAIQAKMSDRDGRQALALVRAKTADARVAFAAADAEREARAILAETEPVEPGGLRMCAHLHTGWRAHQDTTAAALADALRSFLGCEQHVAMGERS